MKFKDIPKYTRVGSYQVNIPLEALLYQINRYIDELCMLELNPDFQRGHVWTEKQQIAFVHMPDYRSEVSRQIAPFDTLHLI